MSDQRLKGLGSLGDSSAQVQWTSFPDEMTPVSAMKNLGFMAFGDFRGAIYQRFISFGQGFIRFGLGFIASLPA
ncbi:hypothetical protein [Leisingera sp. ANG-M1]|uniref:hypothetical protein n=1 Tax=Leisingera sp. ANG-M1 TaxID=1577895 RepID=UPI00126A0471|nr:hypothetical protein [Leisingera sp. ANG-M1]